MLSVVVLDVLLLILTDLGISARKSIIQLQSKALRQVQLLRVDGVEC